MTDPILHGGALWTAILVMAGITFLTRAFPFLVYSGGRRPSAMVLYLGRVLPPAIMALLVVYCFKDIRLGSAPHGVPEVICCGVVLLLQHWRKNAMLSIGAGTVLYMVLIQVVFA